MYASRWLLRGLVFTLVALVSPLKAAPPPPVELITDTEVLQPTTTLEFRFAHPMITREEVGISPESPPITITPKMPGRFTWLSRSSGVFVPQGPLPLGTTYSLSVRNGLTSLDRKPIPATEWTLQTPRFGQTSVRNPGGEGETLRARPRVLFAYNLPVDLTSAEGRFEFVSATGNKVPAIVRYGTHRDYFHVPIEQGDWEQRWRAAQPGGASTDTSEEGPDEEDQSAGDPADFGASGKPIFSQLAVAPAKPLEPGAAWRLEVKAGLRSRDGKYQVESSETLPLGTVAPFQITKVIPSSYINSGRSVSIEFSESLAPDILSDKAARFFRVEPAAGKLDFHGYGSSFTITGKFELGREYRLIAGDDVISIDGVPLQGERTKTFRFGPIAPRLYLPEITAHQIRSGRRKFEVLSANLLTLRVTARLVAPDSLPKAVKGFESYHAEDGSPDEPFRSITGHGIAGQILHERTIELPPGEIDARQVTLLDWNEIAGEGKPGAIFLTVEGIPRADVPGKKVGAQALIQLTDLGVLWKKHAGGLRVSVFSMRDGKPVDATRIALLDAEFQPITEGKTDGSGTANVGVPRVPAWLLVSKGDDAHALQLGPEGSELPMAAFRVPVEYVDWESQGNRASSFRAMIFTDRPLYRPGEVVRIKGLVRPLERAALEGIAGTLKLYGPRNYESAPVAVKTNVYGSFDTSLTLPSEITGAYRVQLSFPDAPGMMWQRGMQCIFQAADFQPDAFELKVDLPSRVAPTSNVSASLLGNYFFGAPVANANVTWTLQYVSESFEPEGFEGWVFGDQTENRGKMLTLNGEGVLDGIRPFVIKPKLPSPSNSPARGVLTVEVTDLNQQTVSSSRMFTRDSAEFYLGQALPDGIVFRAGSEISTQAIAVTPEGKPLTHPVPVKAELIYMRFDTVRVQGAGNAVSFRTEKTAEPVAQMTGQTLVPTYQQDAWVVREGETVKFKADRAGQYQIRLTATDSQGRNTTSVMSVYVSGKDEVGWDYRNPAQVELVPDKAEYRPGDIARIMVKSPISGDGSVFIERGQQILRTLPVQLEGNSPVIEIPIKADDGPNVFVSLVMVRGLEQSTRKHKTAEYRYGTAMLRVVDPRAHLQVTVRPAKPELEPQEEVVSAVVVTDGEGKPVPDAEVTFWSPDDGILALTGYERPAPSSVFGAPFPLAVRSGITLMDVLPEDPGALEFSNKGYLIGGGGLEGPGLKLRSNFPGTACWFPSLRTGPDGTVTVRFRAPDALTRYRLVAVASAGNLFGSGESAFAIRKPLMLMPALGQFANEGDELVARAVVRNDSGADADVNVSLALDSLAESIADKGGRLMANLRLGNGEARAVEFPIRIKATGTAQWQWTARMEGGDRPLEDEVISTVRITSPSPILRETYLSDLSSRTNDLLEGVNPQLLEGTGTVEVLLSNTRVGTLRESVNQLLTYPYGCSEQTISAVIPWLLTRELGRVIPELSKPEEEVRDVIRKALDRVFSMQTSDGGIAMWPNGNKSSLFISAYTAIACALLPPDSPDVPVGEQALRSYLDAQLRGMGHMRDEWDLAERALVLYAQALRKEANAAYLEELYGRRKELSHESRALVALAIAESGGSSKMVEDLLNPKIAAPEAFSFFGGAARERAIRLMAWTRHDAKAREVGRLVKELLGYRQKGHWGTTQQNAWSLLALSRYYASAEKGPRAQHGALIRHKQPTEFQLPADKPTFFSRFGFNPSVPLGSVAVANPEKGALFGETRFAVKPPVSAQPRQNRGYAVSRSYQKLAADGSLQSAGDLKVGDRVLVTLQIETARPGHFVAIDDPLPAVLEAVNPAFKSRTVAGGEEVTREDAANYSEVRADRVLYFCDHLPPGAYSFRYLARVRAAGTTVAGPTKAEEMYRPERFGLGESMKLTAKAAN